MENFVIEQGEDTPEVNFNASSGIFEISGVSRPEDVTKIYDPIISWIKSYTQNPQSKTEVNFKFIYFNTASARKIFEVMAVFDELNESKKSEVTINWYYDKPDLDMKAAGEEYQDLLNLRINFFPMEV